jgi:hypothetical protein
MKCIVNIVLMKKENDKKGQNKSPAIIKIYSHETNISFG